MLVVDWEASYRAKLKRAAQVEGVAYLGDRRDKLRARYASFTLSSRRGVTDKEKDQRAKQRQGVPTSIASVTNKSLLLLLLLLSPVARNRAASAAG